MMISNGVAGKTGVSHGRSVHVLVILVLPLLISLILPAVDSDGEIVRNSDMEALWSCIGGGPLNNNRVESDFSELMPIISWEVSIDDDRDFPRSAVIDSDNDIIFSAGESIYKFDENGSVLWKVELTDPSVEDLDPSIPTVDSAGNIYAVLRNGSMMSLDPNGTFRWFFDISSRKLQTGIGPPICVDDVIYYCGSTSLVHAVDADGSLLWSYPLEDQDFSSVAVSGTGMIAVTSVGLEKGLIMLDSDGDLIWSVEFPDHEAASPPSFDDDGNVYVSLNDQDGSIIRSYHPNGTLRYESVGLDFLSTNPRTIRKGLTVAGNGDLILIQNNGYVARMRGNGMLLWEKDMQADPKSSASVSSDGSIIVPAQDRIIMVNPDGSEKAVVPANSNVRAMAFDGNGTGYLIDGWEGVVTRIDMVPNPPPVPVDDPPDIEFPEDGSYYLELNDIIWDNWTDPVEVAVESGGDVLRLEYDPLIFWLLKAEENFTGEVTARFIISDSGPDLIPGTEDDPVVVGSEFNVSVTPVNDPPAVEEIGSIRVISGSTARIPVNATDVDSDDAHLTYSIRYAHVDWIHMSGSYLVVAPPLEEEDDDQIEISVMDDSMAETIISIDIEMSRPNLPPEVDLRESRLKLYEDQIGRFEIGSGRYDDIEIIDPDNDPVFYHFTDGPHIHVVDTGRSYIEIVPEEDWNGWTNFTIFLDDGYHQVEYLIDVWVSEVGEPIKDLWITITSPTGVFDDGTRISLFAEYIDPDDPYDPDGYHYDIDIEWYSNLSGYLGEGQILNTTLESGYHTIEVKLSKDAFHPRFAHMEVFVEDRGGRKNGDVEYRDYDEIEETEEAFIIGGLLYVIVLFFPVAAVVIHRIKLRRSGLLDQADMTGRSGDIDVGMKGGDDL